MQIKLPPSVSSTRKPQVRSGEVGKVRWYPKTKFDEHELEAVLECFAARDSGAAPRRATNPSQLQATATFTSTQGEKVTTLR
ncbi:hypothetical protein E2C01_066720 [Portunus trituberculatus]|uniref:Uncharacterized protein n=1 Tax=Portunus trituberculatus TaxID=210409 RepID=A0A5B7HRQ8_PORTR|nr:hypothetical protein [Portunus trituberculatus]